MEVSLAGEGEISAAQQAAKVAEDRAKLAEELAKAESESPPITVSEFQKGKPPGLK